MRLIATCHLTWEDALSSQLGVGAAEDRACQAWCQGPGMTPHAPAVRALRDFPDNPQSIGGETEARGHTAWEWLIKASDPGPLLGLGLYAGPEPPKAGTWGLGTPSPFGNERRGWGCWPERACFLAGQLPQAPKLLIKTQASAVG